MAAAKALDLKTLPLTWSPWSPVALCIKMKAIMNSIIEGCHAYGLILKSWKERKLEALSGLTSVQTLPPSSFHPRLINMSNTLFSRAGKEFNEKT